MADRKGTYLAFYLGHKASMVSADTKHFNLIKTWALMEVGYAVDNCSLPIIAAYTHYEYVLAPKFLSSLWPQALASRIESGIARVMHIPFKKTPIKTAINQFYPANPIPSPLAHYSERTDKKWGLIK